MATLLGDALYAPYSDDEAASKIQAVVGYVETIKVKGHPAPGHVPFLLSYFWSLADQRNWSVIWPSAAAFAEFLGGDDLPQSGAEKYRLYMKRIEEVAADVAEFEITAKWWDDQKAVIFDEVLTDRAGHGVANRGVDRDDLEANARALARVSQWWGKAVEDDVLAALGRRCTLVKPSPYQDDGRPRSDLKIDLREKGSDLFFRVWLNERGAAIGLSTGPKNRWWYSHALPVIEAARCPEYRIMAGPDSEVGEDLGLLGNPTEFVYGRWVERDRFGDTDLRAVVVDAAATLKPLYNELEGMIREEAVKGKGLGATPSDSEDDELAQMVARWKEQEKYPGHWLDEEHDQRARWAKMLAPDSIATVGLDDLSQIWRKKGGVNYGSAGRKVQLNQTLRDFDSAEYATFLESLHYLCWGNDPYTRRIDRLLDKSDLGTRGLGEALIMKLLAITHPEDFSLIYPMDQRQGVLKALDIKPPSGTLGERCVATNRLLIDRLKGLFPGDRWGLPHDPLGVSFSAYHILWNSEQQGGDLERAPQVDAETVGDRLERLAEELFVAPEFLEEIVELLEDKGQVVFYGPPGTGKTYLARKLAEALAPHPSRRKVVQFHPASSYEDFFEGYRPQANARGEMTYALTPGPLALLAEEAETAPGQRHVMVIDEINRANLPKVLGELLFLLEYRDESVSTLYRAGDEFALPKNLWFIATMNTADRSIALVDAALRRRFHFMPFFPNHGPMEKLLDRWLDHNGEPSWVGELVASVNQRLEVELGGPHLQIGPSHFMKPGLDKEAVRRIWEYNIEPFIEDQFFGDLQQIENYRFDNVYRSHVSGVDRTELAEPQAPPDHGVGTATDQDPSDR